MLNSCPYLLLLVPLCLPLLKHPLSLKEYGLLEWRDFDLPCLVNQCLDEFVCLFVSVLKHDLFDFLFLFVAIELISILCDWLLWDDLWLLRFI